MMLARASMLLVATGLSAQELVKVATPQEKGHVVAAMRAFSQSITADGQKRLWTLVYESDPQDKSVRQLWLLRSEDRGKTWKRIAKAPLGWNAYGAIAGTPDSSILHVGWAGRVANDNVHSAVYQQFDGDAGKWIGEPEVLQRGTGTQDQFTVADLAIDRDGTIAALVQTHRHPKQPPWPSGWSTGLMVRKPVDAAKPGWHGPYPINSNRYGVWANLQLHEGRAHATYRTSHSMIGYRSFSLDKRTFDQKADVEISVKPNTGRHVSNASSLLVGPFGSRTVVYPAAGQRREAKGQLLLAYAEADGKWSTTLLADDPPMANGNVFHEHFALVRGPGRQAIALFSKVGEQHKVLYRRMIDGGKPMGGEREIARSELAGAFKRITAMRDGRLMTGVWALVSGQDEGASLGVRAVIGSQRMPTRWQ